MSSGSGGKVKLVLLVILYSIKIKESEIFSSRLVKKKCQIGNGVIISV
jgi:hypothetical protein